MRWCNVSLLLIPLILSTATAEWSWGDNDNKKEIETEAKTETPELFEGEDIPKAESKSLDSAANDTVLDDIVDEIISSKQGRSLGGFDDVYADPTIKQALDSGDDIEARNLIKERLCTLGLMQCDGEDIQEKRPYVSPDDLIYAQPVDIKPIGRPIASIPVRGPPRAYGPPKPIPYPSRPQKVPPKRIGYGGSSRPGFAAADKYGQVNGGNFQFSQSSGSFNGFNEGAYLTKPTSNYANDSPYAFDNIKTGPGPVYSKPQAIPISQTAVKTDTVVQQHVHHHYVHGEAEKDPKVIIKPVAIPVGSAGSLASVGSIGSSGVLSSSAHQSSSSYLDSFDDFSNVGFKPMAGAYPHGAYLQGSKPIYESSDLSYGSNSNKGSLSQGNQHISQLNGQYAHNSFDDSQKYGNSLGAYGHQDFYKKELQVGSTINSNNIYNRGPATYTNGQSYSSSAHEARQQQFECVCVNYDQCPSQEIIGKRDDLFLPIDPRNKGSEIVALSDEQFDNVTLFDVAEKGTPKDITERNFNSTESESMKKISKRETKEETKEDTNKTIEPRFIGLAGYGGGNGGNGNKNVQPTFGVSFGLPQTGHGAYPLNPFGPDPIHNPYGPALNAGGLNLGLLSVSPLLSLQVTKNDYGEKVIKPLINLHVTPNEHIVNKLGHLFHEKKHYLLNKHEHYHNYPHQYHYKPFGPSQFIPHVYNPQSHQATYSPLHYSVHPPHQTDNFHVHHPHQAQVYKPADYASIHHTPYIGQENVPNADDDYYDDDEAGNYENSGVDINNYGYGNYYGRAANNTDLSQDRYANHYNTYSNSRVLNVPINKPSHKPTHSRGATRGGKSIKFPDSRKKREVTKSNSKTETYIQERQGYFGHPPLQQQQQQQCRANQVCCRRPLKPQAGNRGQCGIRHSQGINGRIKTPAYVDGDSEFGEYPWQAAILKKDPKESVYVCGGTLIDHQHIITAAHCVKQYQGFDLRVRLGEWDVNHDVEFYPYVERDVVTVHVHPQYYAGTLDNDLAILKLEHPVDWTKYPHISPACLPDKYTDFAGQRCWTTGWGKDAFGDFGKYQNILKEVDVPVLSHAQCQQQLKQTRLGYNYELNPGFVCAGGEDGKDACKGDGGGPMVCERGGTWQLVGVVSWGIGCGQVNVPGVYVKVAHYLDWIAQVTGRFSSYN